jgi:hypothetical protein
MSSLETEEQKPRKINRLEELIGEQGIETAPFEYRRHVFTRVTFDETTLDEKSVKELISKTIDPATKFIVFTEQKGDTEPRIVHEIYYVGRFGDRFSPILASKVFSDKGHHYLSRKPIESNPIGNVAAIFAPIAELKREVERPLEPALVAS